MKKIILIAILGTSLFAVVLTKEQKTMLTTAVGAGAGYYGGKLLEPQLGEHSKAIGTIVGATIAAYLSKDFKDDKKRSK